MGKVRKEYTKQEKKQNRNFIFAVYVTLFLFILIEINDHTAEQYIVDERTKVIHKNSCSKVSEINGQQFYHEIDEYYKTKFIKQGYIPCKICNP